MNMCDNGHDEICYEVRDCPLCAKISECESLEVDANQALNDLESANQYIIELEGTEE